ncbi:hypothetical protein TNCV_1717871 [Trichonephila clavipes]|nr:hypothetical protein TNCV_1717871 [Trichonephila clavipes]
MSSRHHIDDFMRGRIIERSKKGENNRCCQGVRHHFHSVVSRLWVIKKQLECVVDGMGGRVRSTTPVEDRYIVLSAKEQVHHSSTGGKSVSYCLRKADLPKTVARRLRGGGLYARRPVVCVPLTRQHRTARLQWCGEHRAN